MNAVARRQDDARTAGAVERRRTVRQAVRALATITSSRGHSTEAELTDLSCHGLRVVGETPWLRVGQFVSIALEEEPPVQAIVRWIRGDEAGMEFLRPLPADRKAWHALID